MGMLRSLASLRKRPFQAQDDHFGQVCGFLFHESEWRIGFLVMDTGSWLSHQTVLISPQKIRRIDDESERLILEITKGQVEESVPLRAAESEARGRAQRLSKVYRGSRSRLDTILAGDPLLGADRPTTLTAEPSSTDDGWIEAPELTSVEEIKQYRVEALDGPIGRLEEIICNDRSWTIRHLVLALRSWGPGGKKVLIPPSWVGKIDRDEGRLYLERTRKQIKNSPRYLKNAPVNQEGPDQLYDYHGRPVD